MYEKTPTPEELDAYNEVLGREGGWATGGLSRMAEIVGTAAETTLRKRKRPYRNTPWPEEAEEWFNEGGKRYKREK